MTKLNRIITAIALVLGAVLLFIMVTQVIDRCSRHEDAWAKLHKGITQDIPSPKVSDNN